YLRSFKWRFRVGLVRIELTTSALSVLRSNRLSYSPRCPGWRTFEATPPPLSFRHAGRPPASPIGERRGDQCCERVSPRTVDREVGTVRSEPLRVLGGQCRPVRDDDVGVSSRAIGEHGVVGV